MTIADLASRFLLTCHGLRSTKGELAKPIFERAFRDKFAIEVKDLDIDLIDRINPFEAAYSVLAKAMNEGTLKQVAAVIGKRKVSIPYDEARDLAVRALQWKKERGRAPEITSQDPWEKRLAEGVAALAKFRAQQAANG